MKVLGCMTMLTAAMLLCAGTGCQAPAQPIGPTLANVPTQDPQALERLWQSTEDALLSFDFKLDRRDRQAGVLTTVQETSANWFELWLVQPRPSYYWMESNLQTIGRQAEVHIRPVVAGACEVQVKVDRYRYSLEERQVDNAAAAMRLYSSQAPTTSGQMAKPSESSRWVHLGRDGAMEQALLNTILHRYSEPTTTAPAS
jgi:hypothetical protein